LLAIELLQSYSISYTGIIFLTFKALVTQGLLLIKKRLR